MKVLLLLFSTAALAFSPGQYVDKSESIFFPKEFGEKLTAYKAFPAFWWNFFVFVPKEGKSVRAVAEDVCPLLKKNPAFKHVECQPDPGAYLPLIEDWARDTVLRQPPPKDILERFSTALAQMSLPIPEAVFQILRVDPLRTSNELREMLKSRLRLGLDLKEGFFTDEKTQAVAIPIQLDFSPAESDRLSDVVASITQRCADSPDCKEVSLLGPHGSTLENKQQIMRDLHRVSAIGIGVLFLCCLFVILFKQAKLALLFVPVGIATGLAAVTTILIFGKIHGLTLAFGTGIVGLITDYGLQAAFNARSPHVWRSNFLGFATTVISLVVIAFTDVPLLRQLMVFSIFGMVFGFGILYAGRFWIAKNLSVKALAFTVPRSTLLFTLTLVCMVSACTLPFLVHPQFELNQFNYQSAATADLSSWFFQKAFPKPPLFSITKESYALLTTAHQEKRFAEKNALAIENLANYLPELKDQELALAAWRKTECGSQTFSSHLDQNSQKLFEPFLQNTRCEKLKPRLLENEIPKYLAHLFHDGQWLTLWFPKNDLEVASIRKEYPKSLFLGELVEVFPRLLAGEMLWMFPLSITFILFFLFLYYRKISLCLLGIVPFLSGLGFTLGMGLFFHIPLTFVSLIALIMVLGFSVDYAVFSLDAELGRLQDRQATSSGLLYAAGATLLGFIPLIFCRHLVLSDLGFTLTFGMFGTILGAFWGIPHLVRKII